MTSAVDAAGAAASASEAIGAIAGVVKSTSALESEVVRGSAASAPTGVLTERSSGAGAGATSMVCVANGWFLFEARKGRSFRERELG